MLMGKLAYEGHGGGVMAETNRVAGRAMRVRIYVVLNDVWRGRNLSLAVLETLQCEGCAGATVWRTAETAQGEEDAA